MSTRWCTGNYYGTLKATVKEALDQGTDVLLDIDVQGAATIRKTDDPMVRDSLVDVFIMPPTIEELEKRLRKRGTETEEQVQQRLHTGREESKLWRLYKYTILSGSMEEDLTKFRAIMRAERYLSRRLEYERDKGSPRTPARVQGQDLRSWHGGDGYSESLPSLRASSMIVYATDSPFPGGLVLAWRLLTRRRPLISIPAKTISRPVSGSDGGNNFSIFNGDPKRIQRANAVDPKSFDTKVDVSPNPLSLRALKAAAPNPSIKITFRCITTRRRPTRFRFPRRSAGISGLSMRRARRFTSTRTIASSSRPWARRWSITMTSWFTRRRSISMT